MVDSKSILLVEGYVNLCFTFSVILSRAGYWVTTATSTKEARSQLAKDSYSLILLDERLLRRNGFALLRELKQAHRQVPVIVLAANDALEREPQVQDLGEWRYVHTPVDPDQVLEQVQKVFTSNGRQDSANRVVK